MTTRPTPPEGCESWLDYLLQYDESSYFGRMGESLDYARAELAELRAEIERLRTFVQRIALRECDIDHCGTWPDCRTVYKDQRRTHWCLGCEARQLLEESK